jgi:hypothetical protein
VGGLPATAALQTVAAGLAPILPDIAPGERGRAPHELGLSFDLLGAATVLSFTNQ